MSSVDILRSFAESREHDAVMIRGGINYGNVRDVLRRVAELEAALAAERERLEAKKLEVDAAMDCYKAALNAMRKDWREMFESTQAAGVELAAERERRKAAEALLHNYARLANAAMFDANRSGYEYDRKGGNEAADALDGGVR